MTKEEFENKVYFDILDNRDTEKYGKRLVDLVVNIWERRHTGRSTRRVQAIIDEFFARPMGTKIPIVDHYDERRAHLVLADSVCRRLNNDYPWMEYELHRNETPVNIVRKSKTMRERDYEEYERLLDEYVTEHYEGTETT